MKYIIIIIFYFLVSCQQSNDKSSKLSTTNKKNDSIPKNEVAPVSLDISAAKFWLSKVISEHFDGSNPDMQNITTPEYFEFKMDAMNVGLDTEVSLTEEEFNKKWGNKYEVNTHPIYTGFLISGQDWGKIVVKQIEIKKINTESRSIVFETLIRDNDFGVDYDRDIVVVEKDGKFLISDVFEYD
ncbi:MAG: hypothetical protein ACI35V_07940 [Sphingobacterium composti]|uniref:hypothetical protein n=1 Tax=Sphingobacterium composti TaxID=363260 RepID=UPI0013590FC0|nr:hypothetical protein [Sphingobacterium composti Ten et al. 2007 non Yoo et al. 2007]